METKFTKGPWRVSRAPRTKARGIDILNAHELRIASCPEGHWLYKDHDKREANAHLIAAAPDMYAALMVAELASEELCQGQDPANECWVTLAMIRASLAKARGEAK